MGGCLRCSCSRATELLALGPGCWSRFLPHSRSWGRYGPRRLGKADASFENLRHDCSIDSFLAAVLGERLGLDLPTRASSPTLPRAVDLGATVLRCHSPKLSLDKHLIIIPLSLSGDDGLFNATWILNPCRPCPSPSTVQGYLTCLQIKSFLDSGAAGLAFEESESQRAQQWKHVFLRGARSRGINKDASRPASQQYALPKVLTVSWPEASATGS